MRRAIRLIRTLLSVVLCLVTCYWLAANEPARQRTTPWVSSNVKGSPDPALPYRTQRVYRQVELTQPTDVVWLPDARRWIATQVNGQIISFDYDQQTATTKPLLDLNQLHERPVSNAVSMTFHPNLTQQPWCYVCYASEPKAPQGKSWKDKAHCLPLLPAPWW